MIDALSIQMEILACMRKTAGVADLPLEHLRAVARQLGQGAVRAVNARTDVVVGWSWGPTWHGTLTMYFEPIPRGGELPEVFHGMAGGYAIFALDESAGDVERAPRDQRP